MARAGSSGPGRSTSTSKAVASKTAASNAGRGTDERRRSVMQDGVRTPRHSQTKRGSLASARRTISRPGQGFFERLFGRARRAGAAARSSAHPARQTSDGTVRLSAHIAQQTTSGTKNRSNAIAMISSVRSTQQTANAMQNRSNANAMINSAHSTSLMVMGGGLGGSGLGGHGGGRGGGHGGGGRH